VLLFCASSTTSLGGMVHRNFSVGRVMVETCMMEALSGTMVTLAVNLAWAMQI
jgi:hypothetical protein